MPTPYESFSSLEERLKEAQDRAYAANARMTSAAEELEMWEGVERQLSAELAAERGECVRVKCVECNGEGSYGAMSSSDDLCIDEIDCAVCSGRGYEIRSVWKGRT